MNFKEKEKAIYDDTPMPDLRKGGVISGKELSFQQNSDLAYKFTEMPSLMPSTNTCINTCINTLPDKPKKGCGKLASFIKRNVKMIGVYLFKPDREKLSALADWLKCSRSEVMRKALNDFWINSQMGQ